MSDKPKYPYADSTPMMRKWLEIKQSLQNNPIVFCRVGDFFELFYDDAERASKILDLQLTSSLFLNLLSTFRAIGMCSIYICLFS